MRFPPLAPRGAVGTPVPWRHTALLVTGCALVALVRVFVTVGFLLALYLELTGFGTPTAERLHGVYIALLAGATAGVLLPACLARLLLRGRYRAVAGILVVVIAATAVVVTLLGTWG